MNVKLLAAAAALIASFSLGIAQEDGKKSKRPEGGKATSVDPAQRAEMMIQRHDKDGDGKLSKAEFAASPMAERFKDQPERVDRMFAALDTDKDGKLSKEELAAAPARGKGRPGAKGEGRDEGEGKTRRPEGRGEKKTKQ